MNKKPDLVTTVASSSDNTKASEVNVGLQLASKKSKKSTKPNGASKEEIVETYVSVDAGAYDIDSKKNSTTSTVVKNNLLNIFVGGGLDVRLEIPKPRYSLLVTYGDHAGQGITDGVVDHSIFYHYRLLSF